MHDLFRTKPLFESDYKTLSRSAKATDIESCLVRELIMSDTDNKFDCAVLQNNDRIPPVYLLVTIQSLPKDVSVTDSLINTIPTALLSN